MSSNNMTNILDLPDDCLLAILENLDKKKDLVSWSKVCGRFCRIYSEYFVRQLKRARYEENLLDDYIATHCAHLLGTQYSPLGVIKTVRLNEAYTSSFWEKLGEHHTEIEEAELLEINDDDLIDLLPLPNLKRLKCAGKKKLTRPAKSWQDIIELFNPEHGLNPLRYVPPINELKSIEEVEIDCQAFKWWMALGKLPTLKVLTLNKFNASKCDYGNSTCDCGADRVQYLVDNLLEFNNLENLTFKYSCMTQSTMQDLATLTSLKKLCMIRTMQEDALTLNMFSGLVNLEELHIGNLFLNKSSSWRFFRMCEKLKYLRVSCHDEATSKVMLFLTNMIKSRTMELREPVKVVVCQSYFQSVEIFHIPNPSLAASEFTDYMLLENTHPCLGGIFDLYLDELPWVNEIKIFFRSIWCCFVPENEEEL